MAANRNTGGVRSISSDLDPEDKTNVLNTFKIQTVNYYVLKSVSVFQH